MKRRQFIAAAGALPFVSSFSFAQDKAPKYADMHAHLGFKRELSYRDRMAAGNMLLVAEKATPDVTLLRLMGNKLGATREAKPGELRRNFELGAGARLAKVREEGLGLVDSVAALDQALGDRKPSIVLSAEGADFLEGDLAYIDKARAMGLVHLQLVHYYRWSGIGDISTEEPQHKGLTALGRDLVRACNRLGILVDVAHCSHPGMEQALEISSRPIVYSHGHVSAGMPAYSQSGSVARAIHLPMAKAIAAKGGVIGFWPDWYTYSNIALMADALSRAAGEIGAAHVGIGSDMHGLVRTIMPSYVEFAALEEELSRRGMKAAEVEGILGGNYLRVLREAMKT
jgi:membrane dipeptidase